MILHDFTWFNNFVHLLWFDNCHCDYAHSKNRYINTVLAARHNVDTSRHNVDIVVMDY